jgi:hypothetical protein
MPELADLPLWPDTVAAFYADRACSIRSEGTRKSWGYAYRRLQLLHPTKVGARLAQSEADSQPIRAQFETRDWLHAESR